MAITLGQLKVLLNFALGTSETNLLTKPKREDAINASIQNILEDYAIPQYVISANLSFTNGVASLPTDCITPLKLNDPNQKTIIYDRINWDNFSYNLTQTYTIKWDTVSSSEKMYIYPANTTTLEFWYVQNQPVLTTDSNTIRFNPWWAKPIAEKAAEKLFTDSASFNRADAKEKTANDLIAKAWQTERARITGVQDNKLTSIFTKKSLLGSSSFPFNG